METHYNNKWQVMREIALFKEQWSNNKIQSINLNNYSNLNNNIKLKTLK